MTRQLVYLLVSALFAPIATVYADEFPDGPGDPSCPDDMATGAIFKISLLNQGVNLVVELSDDHTIVGRSNPHKEGDAADDGALICGAGVAPFEDMLQLVPDPCRQPNDWVESPVSRREVHTQILALELKSDDNSVIVRAGQPFLNSVKGTAQERFFRYSIGEVASEYDGSPVDFSKDFSAKSYFNVYIEVEILLGPGQTVKLYNKSPMVLSSELTQFPPDFDLPQSTYIHDPSFGPVALYDAAGNLYAYLSSAGHGSTTPSTNQGFNNISNADPLTSPVCFAVDRQSDGTSVAIPNHVAEDFGHTSHVLTIYQSATTASGGAPNLRNVRKLVGATGGTIPPNFATDDAINSISFGVDGTIRPYQPATVCSQHPGVLFFSVSRQSTGVSCSDVHRNATGLSIAIGEAAADIYASRVGSFGHYSTTDAVSPPTGNNVLVTDNTDLGLVSMSSGVTQANLTSLELANFSTTGSRRSFVYLSLTGPSFTDSRATIYVYDPADGVFHQSNLTTFATLASLGLQTGDIIDALAVSDVDPSQQCPPTSNRTMDAGVDQVLFSLAPGSPSLTGQRSAADIFKSDFDGSFAEFCSYADLGLLPTDDVDAIDIKPITAPFLRYDYQSSGAKTSLDVTLTVSQIVNINSERRGGRYPFAYTTISGSLPGGLALNPLTGNISGSPTSAQVSPQSVDFRVTDFDNFTSDAQIVFIINPAPTISYPTSNTIATNQSVSIPAIVSGGTGPFTFGTIAGALPDGLSLNVSDGTVSGIPLMNGSYTTTIELTDANGVVSSASLTIHVVTQATIPTAINLRLALQGAQNGASSGTIMNTGLNNVNLLPLSDPYTASVTLASIPSTVVDWVAVQLRSGTGATTALAEGVGFVRSDGLVTGSDGISQLLFDQSTLPPGDYYIVVKHRNHLWLMSSGKTPLATNASIEYNFTSSQAQAFSSFQDPMIHDGAFGMVTGDASNGAGQLGIINAADRVAVRNASGSVGYLDEDLTLDGLVSAPDRVLVQNNSFRFTQVP